MKKVLALILALSLSLACLAACGSNTGASPTPAASAAATTQPATPAESAAASPAEPELTDYVYLATQPVGTSYYALGTGIADLINSNTPINATVTPYSGPDEFMVDTLDGTVNMGLSAIMDLSWAYSGTVNYDTPYDNLRLVASGNWSNHATMTVLKSSDIQSYKDLAGKKVGYDFGGNKLTVLLTDAALASVDLTIDDCVKVGLTDLPSALSALQEGRVDATYSGSPTAAAAVELNQSVGIRVLPFADLKPEDIKDGVPEKYQKILDEYVPGSSLKVAPASGTLTEPEVLISYPIVLFATTDLTEDDVYAMTKALYENYAKLGDAHVWGKGWTPESFVLDHFTVPYHDGAVKLFKEVGIWTDEADAMQKTLLSK